MGERKFREQGVQIARYGLLKRKVTDPLAPYLLHVKLKELENCLARGSAGDDPQSMRPNRTVAFDSDRTFSPLADPHFHVIE